ncbi:acyl carrier protein [Streptomyces sp. NPDC001880]
MSRTSQGALDSAELERKVIEWATEILEEPATPQDNFLDLGGHSMLAVQLNQRISDEFGAELDMQILFERSIGEAVASIPSLHYPNAQNG